MVSIVAWQIDIASQHLLQIRNCLIQLPHLCKRQTSSLLQLFGIWLPQEAKTLSDGGLARGGSFGALLADYVRTGGALPAQAAQVMADEATRLLRGADRAAWTRPSFRHKALLYVMLGGDRRVAEHLFRVRPLAAAAAPFC